jgi:2-methylcitrate dehydratase PrpD
MKSEERLVEFISNAKFEDFSESTLRTVKNQFLAIAGTTLAGACEAGCEEAVRFYRELGGREEATVLVHGGKLPAHDAAFVNAVMARALDLCDSIAPGPHIGAALIAGALAAVELKGGMSGKDFFTAITVGSEVAVRLNLSEKAYDGFDPTGICVIFGVAAAVSRILGLDGRETWNALALAFNRCGGSFQSHVDGSLGVRFVQGWVAQGGVICARLASRGITGPKNFLDGIYGYLHLYGKDLFRDEQILADLGKRYALENMVFKKYPSCALTQGPTEAILRLMAEEKLSAGDIDLITVTVPPYTHKLVGHEFEFGENPRVNAQFSIRFCVANALVRGCSSLEHFEESRMRDAEVLELAGKVTVIPDETLEKRGHTPMDMKVSTKDGREIFRQLDIGPGFPGNPLSPGDHEKRFRDCLSFAKKKISEEQAARVVSAIEYLEKVDDVRELVHLFSAH